MRSHVRAVLAGLLTAASLAVLAPAAQASFGVTENNFEAGTCFATSCKYSGPRSAFYTQAAGHPPWGITKFELNHTGTGGSRFPEGAALKRIRVDVPPGLAANPEALPKCAQSQFLAGSCPGNTKVGTTEMEAIVEALPGVRTLLSGLEGNVFNVQPPQSPPGAPLPLYFGIEVAPLAPLVAPVRLFLEGHVDWNGDYHEFFEINNVPTHGEIAGGIKAPLTVLTSQLNFNGRVLGKNFLTLPSVCSASTTSHLEVESSSGEKSGTDTHPPVGVEGCDKVPFEPSTTVVPETSQSDAGDGATTVVQVPQQVGSEEINTSDIKDAHVTLPEGLTLNPAAAHGLEACSAAQIGIGTRNDVACPQGSKVGTVAIETDLPPHSLVGSVFLASPSGGAITDPPYAIYLDAEAPSLDVSVRLQGSVAPNPETGRLEVTFANNPQLPFSSLTLTLNGGEHAPLANPLACGSASTDYVFTPFSGGAAAAGSTPFATDGCASPLPFSIGQGTVDSSPKAGAYTNYTFNLTRAEGQQYVSRLTSTLPAGLVGEIPSIPLCGEPQAQQGSCSSTSQIGTATVTAGSGDPYQFSGPVYLTGPYNGAPYGLSIPVEAAAGPFDLGRLVTRVSIGVDPHSARVIAAATLPRIFKGVPLRLRNISVLVNHAKFLLNPTNCGALSTDTSLTSTFGAAHSVSSPFAVSDCSSLPFKPAFTAATSASTNPTTVKAKGASLRVNLLQGAHEANIRSVVASLPKQLPSRLTTLQKACPEATYAANPFSCPAGSKVGTATVTTPVLPGHLTGPAYLVSHGGAAFPDLDLLLEGDGVRVILTGNTQIKNGVTTSTFGSIPDVPVTSFVLDLPQGPNSALAVNGGSFCTQTLTMPTTITAQSGAVVKQSTNLAVAGCTGGKGKTRLRILSHNVVKHKLVLRVQTFAAGRVSVKARNLRTVFRRFAKPGKYRIKVPLSRHGEKALSARSQITFKVRVGFLPKSKAEAVSVASTKAKFRR